MNRFTVRLIELGIVVAVAVTHAPGRAAAETRDGSYAYIGNGGSITMSGDVKDVARARKQGSGPLLWFREAGQEYIVRDPDTLGQLEAVWKPGRELDTAEDQLDRQHDQLDAKHEQLDGKREQLESRRDALADRASELTDRASDDSASASARAEATKQRRELQQQQQALSDEMRGLESPMKELRTQMAAIQRQLDAVHQKQKAASSKEAAEVRAVFRRAITAGTAKPVK